MCRVSLERHDPAENIARFDALAVIPTRFGVWTVVRVWGRTGSGGTDREAWFASRSEAESTHSTQVRGKQKRGDAPWRIDSWCSLPVDASTFI